MMRRFDYPTIIPRLRGKNVISHISYFLHRIFTIQYVVNKSYITKIVYIFGYGVKQAFTHPLTDFQNNARQCITILKRLIYCLSISFCKPLVIFKRFASLDLTGCSHFQLCHIKILPFDHKAKLKTGNQKKYTYHIFPSVIFVFYMFILYVLIKYSENKCVLNRY